MIQQKLLDDWYTNLRVFIHTFMSFSRNVNHDKMNACHQGHEGNKESIDCNVRQAGTVDYHERSIIGGGPILLMGTLDMIDSVGSGEMKTSQCTISRLN
jgi:hypothetical protein